jgi:hypothetical protein
MRTLLILLSLVFLSCSSKGETAEQASSPTEVSDLENDTFDENTSNIKEEVVFELVYNDKNYPQIKRFNKKNQLVYEGNSFLGSECHFNNDDVSQNKCSYFYFNEIVYGFDTIVVLNNKSYMQFKKNKDIVKSRNYVKYYKQLYPILNEIKIDPNINILGVFGKLDAPIEGAIYLIAVSEKYTDNSFDDDVNKVSCPACKGVGSISGYNCVNCFGRGYISYQKEPSVNYSIEYMTLMTSESEEGNGHWWQAFNLSSGKVYEKNSKSYYLKGYKNELMLSLLKKLYGIEKDVVGFENLYDLISLKQKSIIDFNQVLTIQGESQDKLQDPIYESEKVNELKKSNNIINGMFPQASERILKYEDIQQLSKIELKIMRNEIFARHGYTFKTSDMQQYFGKQNWYSPQFNDVNNKLSEIEKENIKLIMKYE